MLASAWSGITYPLTPPIIPKPLIRRQLPHRRPIPPIQHHHLPNELLILFANFSLCCLVEWRRLRLRDLVHEVQNCREGLLARNLIVFRGEGAEILELPLEDLESVLFVAVGDSAGPEEVEVPAVDETYELQVRRA
jgi:hypothetical protein